MVQIRKLNVIQSETRGCKGHRGMQRYRGRFMLVSSLTTTQYNTTLHNTTQHYTTLDNTIQHNTTLHNTLQHYTTLHNTAQQYTTLYNTTLNKTTQHYTTVLFIERQCRSDTALLYIATCHYTTLAFIGRHWIYIFMALLKFIILHWKKPSWEEKIPHMGDKASLDQCG